MGGGGSPKHTTTTTEVKLPAWAQPYQQQILSQGATLAAQPYREYTGQRIAGFTQPQLQAMQMTMQRAQQGNPLANISQAELARTAGGGYLNITDNPAWRAIASQIGSEYRNVTSPARMAEFSRAGALGGTAFNEMRGRDEAALAQAYTKAAGDLYQAERARQMGAAELAPQFAGLDYADLAQLMGVGDIQRQYQQQLRDVAYQNWLQAQGYPRSQLDTLIAALRGSVGQAGSTMESSPYYTTPGWQQALGAGAALYGAAR